MGWRHLDCSVALGWLKIRCQNSEIRPWQRGPLSCRVRSDTRAIAGCGSTAYCPWLWLCLRFRSKLQRSAATCDDRRRRSRRPYIPHYTNDDTINDIADEWTNIENSRHRVSGYLQSPGRCPDSGCSAGRPAWPRPANVLTRATGDDATASLSAAAWQASGVSTRSLGCRVLVPEADSESRSRPRPRLPAPDRRRAHRLRLP